MRPAERIAAIRETATLLSQQEWGDLDLILRQHGASVTDTWEGDKYNYVIAMIEREPDDKLHELHQYVTGEVGDVPTGPQPWRQGQLNLFMSHLATHQRFVGNVGENLSRSGVSSFVAHNSIEPSEEWQSVIEAALRSCDAMVVFLHEGFKESNWCDQEVGFALARRVPVLPLGIDLMPYGFMGKLQAANCNRADSAPRYAERVLQWLLKTPAAQTPMTEGLVTALERSQSFDNTRQVFRLLEQMPSYTPTQLQRLDRASSDNPQVRNAVFGQNAIPDLLRKFVTERGGTPESAHDDVWADPPF